VSTLATYRACATRSASPGATAFTGRSAKKRNKPSSSASTSSGPIAPGPCTHNRAASGTCRRSIRYDAAPSRCSKPNGCTTNRLSGSGSRCHQSCSAFIFATSVLDFTTVAPSPRTRLKARA
jgi:hypothetical protein